MNWDLTSKILWKIQKNIRVGIWYDWWAIFKVHINNTSPVLMCGALMGKNQHLARKKKKNKFNLLSVWVLTQEKKSMILFILFPFFTHDSIWPFKKSRKIIVLKFSKCRLWEQECWAKTVCSMVCIFYLFILNNIYVKEP